MRLIAACAAALLAALFAGLAAAQDYPSKPIRFIVPYPSGGLTDTLARVIGDRLSSALRRPVLVENKPGWSRLPA